MKSPSRLSSWNRQSICRRDISMGRIARRFALSRLSRENQLRISSPGGLVSYVLPVLAEVSYGSCWLERATTWPTLSSDCVGQVVEPSNLDPAICLPQLDLPHAFLRAWQIDETQNHEKSRNVWPSNYAGQLQAAGLFACFHQSASTVPCCIHVVLPITR